MLDTVYFHIGSPKTGTSVIQSHMAQNRAVLRDKGVLYPLTVSTDRGLYRTFDSHHLLTYSWAGWEPFARFSPPDFFARASATAGRYGLTKMLLSAENTFWLPLNIVRDAPPSEDEYWGRKREYIRRIHEDLGWYDTRILVYLRRQDRWLESWYNQQVKNGNRLTANMEEFAESQRFLLDYEAQLGLWEEVFGTGSVIVRAYEKEQLPAGLLKDYLDVVGLGRVEEYPLRKKPRVNSQLSRDALEFMNICNLLDLEPAQAYRLRGVVRKVTNQLDSELVFQEQRLLSPALRAALVQRYAEGNSQVAARYAGRASGDLFHEPTPKSDQDWAPYSGLDNETVVMLLVKFIMELHGGTAPGAGRRPLLAGVTETVRESLRARLPGAAAAYRRLADRWFWERNTWQVH